MLNWTYIFAGFQVRLALPIVIVRQDHLKLLGGLAQLARAFDWQSKGRKFDSCILHFLKAFS